MKSQCAKLDTLAYKHTTNQFSIVRKLIKKEVATWLIVNSYNVTCAPH
jgi:hypothetical protein